METDRLILRNFKNSDLFDYMEYAGDERVTIPAGIKPIHDRYQAFIQLSYYRCDALHFAIVLKSKNKVIGSIRLSKPNSLFSDNYLENSLELGCILAYDYWGMGIIHEAMNNITDYAFNILGMDALYTIAAKNNKRSKNFQVNCGFKELAVYPNVLWLNGSESDAIIRVLTKDDYDKRVRIH